jgi:hypothetical protein
LKPARATSTLRSRFWVFVRFAPRCAEPIIGISMPASTAMTAMVTSSSMRVNPE